MVTQPHGRPPEPQQEPLREMLGWRQVGRPVFSGGNELQLLRGAAELFPALQQAIAAARHEIWLATYIFHADEAACALADALAAAARRGVRVHMVVDGFGTHGQLGALQARLAGSGVALAVFRPLERWTHWLQPGQLRRLHMKLCVVDDRLGFIGGINLIDDHIDLHHGRSALPRLDFAVRAIGPVVMPMQQAVRAMWSRAWFGHDWRLEARRLIGTPRPLQQARQLMQQMRLTGRRAVPAPPTATLAPVQCALLVRDNFRQRRSIERSLIAAIAGAKRSIWLVMPYFYPGRDFRLALMAAARRGVEVRLLLQGKVDYRLAGLAARVLYDELLRGGVLIHEYTPAFLHAKVMLVDERWATVGSSNIDPLSLLLNLEANLVVIDEPFAQKLRHALLRALAQSREVDPDEYARESRWVRLGRRALVAWVAYLYLRVAGVTGRY